MTVAGDDTHWTRLRTLFDALCDLPPVSWSDRLAELTEDAGLRDEVLELLRAETRTLRGAREKLDAALHDAMGPEMRPGDLLGPWRLVRQIGAGGMGAVFLAERADDLYAQQVAVKLLHGLPDAGAIQRLDSERRILAGLQHPGVARLYDGGTTPRGQPYLVMEYVDGEPVDAYCREHALDLDARLALFVRVCRAVQAAHGRLVVHCDLKPGNVLVRADGEPVLLDFGISQWLEGGRGGGASYCTPAYAAPEMLAGNAPTVASDVFGLGVLLVELLTDRRTGRGAQDRERPVPLPSQLAGEDHPWRRRLRGDPDAIAARACALEPGERYGSAEALADDVERHLRRFPVRARHGERLYGARRFLRRRWREAGAAAAVVALVAGLTGVFVWQLAQAQRAAHEEAQAAQQISTFLVAAFEAADPRKRGARGTTEASAREVLDASAARIDAELDASPALRARLQGVLGIAYQNIGQSQHAQALLRAAADGLAAHGRPQDAAAAFAELAVVLSNGREGEAAERAARQALALLEGHDDDRLLSQAWNALGLALMTRQDHAASEAAFQRSLALRERQPGLVAEVATVKHNLGLLYRHRGDYAQAEHSLREALELKREVGEHTVDSWFSRQALALAVLQQGRMVEAGTLLADNLALAHRLFGEDSALTGDVHNELAGLSQDLGDYGSAAAHYRHALRIAGLAAGEDSVSYSVLLNNSATLDEVRGDVVGAEEGYRRALEIRRRELGADDPSALRAEANLGRLLMRNGHLAEAEPLIRRTLDVWSRRLEPTAPDLLISRLGWAEWQIRSGAFDEATRQLAGIEPETGWPGPSLAFRHATLQAELQQRSGREPGAVDAWRAVLDAAETLYGAESVATARWRIPYAESLLRLGFHDEADVQLRRAAPLRAQLVEGAELSLRMQQVERALAL